jgi:hypothetical protein
MHLKLIINCLFWIDFEWQKIRHARKKNVQKYELFFYRHYSDVFNFR